MGSWLTTLVQSIGKPLQWWIVIALWEQGLRVRLGKTATLLRPGVHFRIPFLDRVFVQSIRCRTLVQTSQTVTTLDKRTVTFTLAVDYYIVDIRRLFNTLSSPEITIMTRACGTVANFIATQNRIDLGPAKIGEVATNSIETKNWGIGGVKATVTSFAEARVYRLLSYENLTSGGLSDLENNKYNGSR